MHLVLCSIRISVYVSYFGHGDLFEAGLDGSWNIEEQSWTTAQIFLQKPF